MSEIKVLQFINHADVNKQENLTLCSEWSNSGCNIYIFGQNVSLKGELTTALINKFANDQLKTSEVYIEETKRHFTLKDDEMEFHVRDRHFKWKKAIWKLGDIKLQPISEISEITEFLQKLLSDFVTFQNSFNTIKSHNASLVSYQKNSEAKMNEMIKLKQSMENELYKKFVLVLNEKKTKIRELESALKTKDEIYDTLTDDSQDLMNSFKKRKSLERRHFFEKKSRIMSDQDSPDTCESWLDKINEEGHVKEKPIMGKERQEEKKKSHFTLVTSNVDEEKVKSTKKDETKIENTIEKEDKEEEENSDEDICLKLTDESAESVENTSCNLKNISTRRIIEPDTGSDDDLFS